MSEGNWPFGCKCLDKEYWSIPENHRRFLQIFENSEVPKVETVPKRRSNLISMERFENPQYVEEEYRLHLYCDSDEAKEIGAGYDLRIENTTLI